LKSWTHPVDADPGPTLIELNLGTAGARTDMCAEITPAEARAVAQALLALAATAEQDSPFPVTHEAGRKPRRGQQGE
jgi:hypothetical protein